MDDIAKEELSTWIISLPQSMKRRKRLVAQLSGINLSYKFFKAVDGRSEWFRLRSSVDTPAFERNTGRRVMKGEIGCYHSHLQVWAELVASTSEVGLVLEDDIVFEENFTEALAAALSVTEKWDILKLSRVRAKLPVRQFDISRWRVNAFVGPATGTGAYLIRREIAEQLLPKMLPITRPIDHEIDRSHVHKIRHFGLVPFPSYTDDGAISTITGKNFSKVKKFAKWRRLPNYLLRWQNFFGKALHTIISNRHSL